MHVKAEIILKRNMNRNIFDVKIVVFELFATETWRSHQVLSKTENQSPSNQYQIFPVNFNVIAVHGKSFVSM